MARHAVAQGYNRRMIEDPGPGPTSKHQTLYLIDGHAQIFRAYYAIRGGMSSPATGEPTQAVFAFTGMLLKLFDQFHPHYVVMTIDTPGPTFRDEIYPEYKATREEPPADLAPQIERIFQVTRLFGIPLLGKPGFEADDVIATLADRILRDPDHTEVDVRVVSKDKDLEQLLGDRVTMFDIHTDKLITAQTLIDEKGITPDQVIDLLTLTGDKVDNIPGVEGVGPKTAAKLLQEYHSVDGVLEHIDQIKGKRREKIEKAREFLPLAKKLVSLDRRVEIDFDLEHAAVGAIDASGLFSLFDELGFRRHKTDLEKLLGGKRRSTDELPGQGTLFDSGFEPTGVVDDPESSVAGLTTASDYEYTAVTALPELKKLAGTLRKQRVVSIDTETIGLGHRAPLCGLCFAWEHGKGVYVPVRSPEQDKHLSLEEVLSVLKPVLEDAGVLKCGHNIKYDLLVLRHAGVHVAGVVGDTMISSHLIGTAGHGMDYLAESLLGHKAIPISRLIGPRERGKTQKTMDQVPLKDLTPYAAEDADITLRLYDLMTSTLTEMGLQRLAGVEMPLVEVLAEMEYHGIRVDRHILGEQKQALGDRIVELRERIHELAGCEFNLDSPKQLGEVLFTRLSLPVVKRTKTGPSTDIEVLETLCEHPELTEEQTAIPRLVVEYRQLTKLVSTYLDSLGKSVDPDIGRVHATFHQTGAATGRLSSSNPNLQNIPIRTEIGRQVRRAFVADPGPPASVLVCADYSQIELRVLAHLSEDPALIEAFELDQDIHAAVAAEVFGVPIDAVTREQRDRAKTINFGIIYGISAFGLARRVDDLDVAGARELIAGYKQRFAGIDAFLDRCIQQAAERGYVTTVLGRRRQIPEINSTNANTRGLGERLAINSVVQGSAADLIKLAMVNLHQRITKDRVPAKLLLQIHDELVLECPADLSVEVSRITREEMGQAMQLRVPLKVEVGVGHDWLSAK